MDNQPTGAAQNQNNSLGGLLQGYPAKAACPHCGYCPHCGRSTNPHYGYPTTTPGYWGQQPGNLQTVPNQVQGLNPTLRVGAQNHY